MEQAGKSVTTNNNTGDQSCLAGKSTGTFKMVLN
jgi:hypothetical protein